MKHHIFVGNDLVATHEKTLIANEKQADSTAYMHRDALGSIDTVTNEGGQIVQQQRYTPFGEDIAVLGSQNTYDKGDLRGFTSHENVGDTGLINMNARLYDPVIGRFVQADTVIPDPSKAMSYNRYIYVYNNPMKYSDPDGHFPFLLGLGLFLFSMTTDDPFLQKVTALAGMAIMGGALHGAGFSAVTNGATLGFISGTAQGGLQEGLKQGVMGGLSAGLTKGVADTVGHGFTTSSVAAQMVVGGVIAEIRGGKFIHGVVASLAGKVGGQVSEQYFGKIGTGSQSDLFGRTAVSMMFGGLGAQASGGSFEDGAMRGLFVHLFNDNFIEKAGAGTVKIMAKAEAKFRERFKNLSFNPTKALTAYINASVAGNKATKGIILVFSGLGAIPTVAGAPIGSSSVALGTWNIKGAHAAYLRGEQQIFESSYENGGNASLRNFLGILPFGTEFDDFEEPYLTTVYREKWENSKLEFIGQFGIFF